MLKLQKTLNLNSKEYFETHLALLNPLFPEKFRMTPMEIVVLAQYLILTGEIKDHLFGPTANRIVRDRLKLSYQGLSNYMRTLTEKGYMYEEGNIKKMIDIVKPENAYQEYYFRLKRIDINETITSTANQRVLEQN